MRNKKYRPWKLTVILCAIVIGFALEVLLLPLETWERILLIACLTITVIISIPCSLLYIEVQSDRIVTRLGVGSLNKAYQSSFKKRVFMFDDMIDICVEGRKILRICLKDGSNVGISIDGFFKKNEIIGLIYEVRAQIKGYKQNYVK